MPGTITFEGFQEDTSPDGTSFNFPSLPIGSAAADRLVILVVHARHNVTANVTIDSISMTGSGNTMTKRVETFGDTGGTGPRTTTSLWSAIRTSGTTANTTITTSGDCLRVAVAVYVCYGHTEAPFHTVSANNANTVDGALNIPNSANVSVIAGGSTQAGTGTPTSTVNDSGGTEAYDQSSGEVADTCYTGAYHSGLAGEIGRTVGFTWSGGSPADQSMVYASFAPVGQTALQTAVFTNDQAYFEPTITTLRLVEPTLFVNAQTFFAHTSNISILPELFVNQQQFFTPSVGNLQTISPALFTNDNVFFEHQVQQLQTISPALFTNVNSFPAFVVIDGTWTPVNDSASNIWVELDQSQD